MPIPVICVGIIMSLCLVGYTAVEGGSNYLEASKAEATVATNTAEEDKNNNEMALSNEEENTDVEYNGTTNDDLRSLKQINDTLEKDGYKVVEWTRNTKSNIRTPLSYIYYCVKDNKLYHFEAMKFDGSWHLYVNESLAYSEYVPADKAV